jgi:hypothetical protein
VLPSRRCLTGFTAPQRAPWCTSRRCLRAASAPPTWMCPQPSRPPKPSGQHWSSWGPRCQMRSRVALQRVRGRALWVTAVTVSGRVPQRGCVGSSVDPSLHSHWLHQRRPNRPAFSARLRLPLAASPGELDPGTHQPFDVAAIYAGCPNPPPYVAALLAGGGGGGGASAVGAPAGAASNGGGGWGRGAAAAGALSGGGSRPRFGMSKKRASGGC